jgi:hypothetical protein
LLQSMGIDSTEARFESIQLCRIKLKFSYRLCLLI